MLIGVVTAGSKSRAARTMSSMRPSTVSSLAVLESHPSIILWRMNWGSVELLVMFQASGNAVNTVSGADAVSFRSPHGSPVHV